MFRSSPTGIATGQLCMARAVAHYVWGYREPENDAMREGTRLHRVVQRYLRTGKVPDASDVAAHACIKVLPVGPGSVYAADTERVVLLDEHHGYIDWLRADKHGDLKFTKNVRYQREKDPTTDPQRIMYAMDAFANNSALVTLKQFWTVTQFDGKQALTLEHKWTKDAAHKQYATIVEPIHKQLAAASKSLLHWQDAPKDQSACDMYPPNGCMMKQHGCRRSLKARLLAIRPKRTKQNEQLRTSDAGPTGRSKLVGARGTRVDGEGSTQK